MRYRYTSTGESRYLAVKYGFVPPDLVIVHTEDVTERKEMEERLMEQERLAVVGQLAGGVSHELHNPLGVIKNATYFLNMVLQEGETEPEVGEALDIMEEQVERSERIIGDLLDFAEQESPAWRDVDVNDVVRAALSRAVVPAAVAVVTELDPALPQVSADADQLAQVFGNLIRNAVQAMDATSPPPVPPARGREADSAPPRVGPAGGREARLTVRSFESSGGVAVSIADTGAGIAEENLERIFEPLFTTRAKGIGLGLALARRLVEAHEGSIEVESEVGEGSVFTVWLPGRRE
jgi:signal transduction histidine kinase